MHPVVISRIKDNELAWKPISYMSRLNEESKVLDTEKVHRVRLSVLGFKFPGSSGPGSIKDCIRVCDSKSGKSRPADAKTTLKKGEVLVFSLPVYVKDFSNLHSNRVNVVHLVDAATDPANSFFPGILPADLLKSEAAQQKAMQALTQLQKFNVYLEAALTASPDGLMLVTSDLTQLKAY